MFSQTYRRRRHGKIEELDTIDLDPYHSIASDAIIGSPTSNEVVFVGPVGIGKTTCVETLSSVLPITTEAKAAAGEEFIPRWKTTTTVGIDYGIWKRDDGSEIGLFGIAGQDRFVDARAVLRNPDIAIVLWLYGDETLMEEQLGQWFPAIADPLNKGRVCIAINFLAGEASVIINKTKQILATHVKPADGGVAIPPQVPVVVADPRNREDVARVVELAVRSNA